MQLKSYEFKIYLDVWRHVLNPEMKIEYSLPTDFVQVKLSKCPLAMLTFLLITIIIIVLLHCCSRPQ